MAQKYHMIKFFGAYVLPARCYPLCHSLVHILIVSRLHIERQKVSRKLRQVHQQLESCTHKKEKKKLEEALLELRVDLNYILVRRLYSLAFTIPT
jgi:hypothetical protein